jgi:hypothetical protein
MPSLIVLTSLLIVLGQSLCAQDAKSIIEAGVKAAGWDKVKGDFSSWSDVGTLNFAGQKMDYKTDWKLHEPTARYSMILKMQSSGTAMEVSYRFDGQQAFESMGDMKQEVTGPKLEYTRNAGNLFRVSSLRPLLRSPTDRLEAIEVPMVHGRPTVGVRVKSPDLRPVTLIFDAGTGLLVKSEMTVANEFEDWKEALEETYYGDWTDAGNGVKNFRTLKVVRGGKTLIESKLSPAKREEKPDWAGSAFAKPR